MPTDRSQAASPGGGRDSVAREGFSQRVHEGSGAGQVATPAWTNAFGGGTRHYAGQEDRFP